VRKPASLRTAAWVFLVGGAAGLVGLLVTPLDLPIYSIGATTLSGRAFAATAGVPFALGTALFLIAGVALLKDYAWSRLSFVVAVLGYGISAAWIGLKTGDAALTGNAGLGGFLLAVVAAIYLYRSSAVRAYYQQLSQRPGDGA